MLNRTQDLAEASDPRDVARILRWAADSYAAAQDDLAASWQDEQAGKVWADFARILNRAADSCERARAKRGA